MLRRLLVQGIRAPLGKQTRLREVKEYLCLREALTPKVAEAEANRFKFICSYYKIEPNQALEISKLLGYDLELLTRIADESTQAEIVNEWVQSWKQSPLYDANADLTNYVQSLRAKYPLIEEYLAPNTARATAIKELERIFSIQNVDSLGSKGIRRIRSEVNQLIKDLGQDESEISKQISDNLGKIVSQLEQNGAVTFAKISYTLALYRQRINRFGVSRLTNFTTTNLPDPVVTRGVISAPNAPQLITAAENQSSELAELADFSRNVIAEAADSNLYLSPFVNDMKRIYQTTLEPQRVWPLTSLAALTTGTLGYALIQGASTYSGLLDLTALAAIFVYAASKRAARESQLYVTRIEAHRSGEVFDIYFDVPCGGKGILLQKVPISSISILSGSDDLVGNPGKVAEALSSGAHTQGAILRVGSIEAILRGTNANIHSFALENLVKGQKVEWNRLELEN